MSTHTKWLSKLRYIYIMVGKIPWRRKWQPTPALLPGEFHRQRSLLGYSPWGYKESDITEWLTPSFHFSLSSPHPLSASPKQMIIGFLSSSLSSEKSLTNDDTILQNKQIWTRNGKPGSRHGFDLGQTTSPLRTSVTHSAERKQLHTL